MLEALRFVQNAVASKDYVPELMHFKIKDGTISSYNGVLSLSCPINLDLEVYPKAVPFIKAVQTCKETVQLHMTANGKLSVRSGKFKALIECLPETVSAVAPEGVVTKLPGGLLGTLKILAPFIADDASRQWARGILLRGQSAFATNNVCLVEKWLEYSFPVEVNIPRPAVLELLRIGEEPESIQMTENSVTFHFTNNRWLRTQTYSLGWPDLAKVLNTNNHPEPIPPDLFNAITDLSPFVDDGGRIYFNAEKLSTSSSSHEGATVEVTGIPDKGIYNFKQLLLLEKVAKQIDFNGYPGPCIFYGDSLRGAIIGMKS